MKSKRIIHIMIVTALLVMMTASVSAATPAEVNAAIDAGLAYQATQQNMANGAIGEAWGSAYAFGQTGEAVLAWENNGHLPGGGTLYSTNVEKGLDYLFLSAYEQPIAAQEAGNPDTNGDGKAAYFDCGGGEILYCSGIATMAIVGSNTPDRVVTTGPLAGQTYKQVITNVVDYMAWSQNDASTGTSRGGWRYGPNYGSSDNSVSQWPVLALVSAEQWGINAPAFVKSELNYWIDYIQEDTTGCSGYTYPDDWSWYSTTARTGALLVEMYYVGDTAATPRAQLAAGCLNTHWQDGGAYGNKGDYYAMYAVFKGLALMSINTLPGPGDWHMDYTDWLLANQLGNGGWPQDSEWGSPFLDTSWAILILQKTILPVEVTITFPACDAKVAYSVGVLTVDGTLTIYMDNVQIDQVTLTGFTGAGTYTTPLAPGTHTYKAILDVTTDQNQKIVVVAENTGTNSGNCGGPNVPEFPSAMLPATMIIGFLGTVLLIQRNRQ